jgi:hypothetical protein
MISKIRPFIFFASTILSACNLSSLFLPSSMTSANFVMLFCIIYPPPSSSPLFTLLLHTRIFHCHLIADPVFQPSLSVSSYQLVSSCFLPRHLLSPLLICHPAEQVTNGITLVVSSASSLSSFSLLTSCKSMSTSAPSSYSACWEVDSTKVKQPYYVPLYERERSTQ